MHYLKHFAKSFCNNKLLLAGLSGFLMAIPQVFPQLFFLAFFALIPLSAALLTLKRGKGGFSVMLVFALTYYLISYSWFLYLHPLDWLGIAHDKSIIAVLLIWLVVTLLHSLVAAFCGFVFSRIKGKLLWDIFLFCFIFILMEAFQGVSAFAFPWAKLAISQHAFLPFLQSAQLFGALFISFLIALINFLLGGAVISFIKSRNPVFFDCCKKSAGKTGRRQNARDKKAAHNNSMPEAGNKLTTSGTLQKTGSSIAASPHTDLQNCAVKTKSHGKCAVIFACAAIAVFTLNVAYGLIAIDRQSARAATLDTITVAAVQGNVTPNEKWNDSEAATPVDRYLELSRQAAENGAKLILWPETTLTDDMYNGHPTDIKLKNFAAQHDVTIVLGSFVMADGVRTNSMLMYSPDTQNAFDVVYNKRHIVPFGEYIPYSDFFEWFFRLFPKLNLKGNIVPGTENKVFESEYGKISTIICFDSVFSKFTREAVQDGAEILMLGTYDSYYRDSANPYQHSAHAVLRAIESDRYLVRASNTGVSSVIAPDGKYLDYLDLHQPGYALAQIAPLNTRTLYSKAGDVLVYLGIGYVLYGVVAAIAGRRKGKSATEND